MALTDQQKKYGLIGAGVVLIGWVLFRPKKASAQELPPQVNINVLPVPAAGGGMPNSTSATFTDAATGTVIAGPSTPLVAPAATATADTAHTVERNESWSNLASRAYGDYRWWPYLWDYNSSGSTQFSDPDGLKRGASIKIPPMPPADTNFKNAIFSRAESHRAYWVNKAKRGSRPRPYPADVKTRTPVPTFSAPSEAPAQPVAGFCGNCGTMRGLGRYSRR
jgi:hypothetical protein